MTAVLDRPLIEDLAVYAKTMNVHTPFDIWMAISRGELDGAAAMMTRKYSVQGNMGLLMCFGELFAAG